MSKSELYQIHTPVLLYPDGSPSLDNWPGKLEHPVAESITPDGEMIYNITQPSLTAYLPVPEKNTGTAVLIAPGGAFRLLSIYSEGTQVAEWLAERGIAAFVLKYRLVHLRDEHIQELVFPRMDEFPMSVAGQPAIEDGFRALELIRQNASRYAINPDNVAAIGFSAGANLVSNLGIAAETTARPDYVASIYGAPAFHVGSQPDLPPADSEQALPPFFLAFAQNDRLVGTDVRDFYTSLLSAGYFPEAHFYVNGDHGFGMHKQGTTSDHFIEQFYHWLQTLGLTQKPGEPEHYVKPPFDYPILEN
ncbi:alpha/beta hydrolase [Vibrio sp. HA2012]|uniref:alpha/beta hydrolase n=1 Tax=Vibrio sp. HA2012 TaxID=1971595 RepID=UPI000C2BD0DB|nr:alpha/beta hydrolase [Vibrio sp. HA2012]PJC87200.1 alpha/beta hydrolase [Vibrio sp. HA2012]